MTTRVMVALETLAGLAIGTPVASATPPSSLDCGFNVIAEEMVTGGQETYTGVAYGHVTVALAAAETVTIRCYVAVNGAEVSSTATGSGAGAVSTFGQVTFTATDTDDIDLCAVWSTAFESGTVCVGTRRTQLPPQEVVDLLDDALTAVQNVPDPTGEPLFCTAIPPGPYPPDIVVDDDGDIYRDGSRVLDCAPFEDPDDPGPTPDYWPHWITDLP